MADRASGVGSPASSRSRTAWIVAGLLAAAAAGLLAQWEPSGDPASTVCGLRRFVGMNCPTCGLTRAAAALAHGRVTAATRLHPLAVPFAIELLGLWIAWGWFAWRGGRAPDGRWLVRLVVANVAVFGIVWVLRM